MEKLDGPFGCIADGAPSLAVRVLGRRLEERQILRDDVLDTEKHIPKTSRPHGAAEIVTPAGECAGHPLHDVVDVMETGLDDRVTQLAKSTDVQRDVVVDEKDR